MADKIRASGVWIGPAGERPGPTFTQDTYLGHTVRIFSGIDWQRTREPVAEGVVVAVCMVPSLLVRHADGTTTHHASSLPLEVMKWEAP